MPISLRISSYQRLTPGQRERFYSTADAFTIGRAKDNDWVMPDPQRFLSGVHCKVERRGDDYYLTDLSTNGTFVNGAEERMERASSVQINDHDHFRIGDYEFEVELGSSTVEVDDSDEPMTEGFAAFDKPSSPAADPFADVNEEDPFADTPPPGPAPATAEPEDDRDLNTPLSHLDHDALDRGVNIDSILDLDDRPTPRAPPEKPADTFKAIHEPMKQPAAAQVSQDDDQLIPDDWDEATGMLRVPDASAAPNDDGDDGFPDDWDITTGGESPFGAPEPERTAADNMAARAPEPQIKPQIEPQIEPEIEPQIEPDPQPEPKRQKASTPPETAAPPPAPAHPPTPAPAPAPAAIPAAAAAAAPPGSALAAFAEGARLKSAELNVQDEAAFFRFLGEVTHAFGEGLMRALSGRASVKNEFRLDQTMIRPSENNPLKFSPMLDDALHRLLRQNDDHAYLQGGEAVREAFEDINAHQLAVMAGMEAALQGLLKRFSPGTLEKRLVSNSVLDNILPGAKKAKYWDIFNLMYAEIANEAEDDFQQLFGSEFTRAYEAQMSRLKNKTGE